MGSTSPTHAGDISPEDAARVHEAVAKLSRRLRAVDLPGNLTQERLSTLTSIRADEPISISALAEVERVSLATMSRMVSGLESEGYVKRKVDKQDGRGVLVSTTAKGRRTHDRAIQRSLTQLIAAISSLEPEQLETVGALFLALGDS